MALLVSALCAACSDPPSQAIHHLSAKGLTGHSPSPADAAFALASACIASHKASLAGGGQPDDATLAALAGCYRQYRDARLQQQGLGPSAPDVEAWLAAIDAGVDDAASDLDEAQTIAAAKDAAANGSKAQPAKLVAPGPPRPLAKPTPAQRAALAVWYEASGGRLEVRWDGATAAPRRVLGDLGPAVPSAAVGLDAATAAAVVARLESVCPGPPGWAWKHQSTKELSAPGIQQVRFERTAGTVPVLDEAVEISVGPDARQPGWRRAFALSTSCHGTMAAAVALEPKVDAAAASGVAAGAWKPGLAGKKAEATLVLRAGVLGGPQLRWKVLLRAGKQSGDVEVDAVTGAVRRVATYEAHGASHSGTLTMQVRKAYDAGTSQGAMPYLEFLADPGDWWALGTTSMAGMYATSASHGASNHSWVPTLVGPLFEDVKTSSTEDAIDQFPADGGANFGVFTNAWVQRRAELFYSLTYSWLVAKSFWTGIPTDEPLDFEVPSVAPGNCNGMVSGSGSSVTLELEGWCGGANERAFRFFSMHEFGHTFRQSIGYWGNHCSNDAFECRAWQEAEADSFAYASNRLEAVRGVSGGGTGCGDGTNPQGGVQNFLPDDRWPDDLCAVGAPGYHDRGNIHSAIFLEQLLDLGWKDALFRTFEPVDEIDEDTTWGRTVGSDTFFGQVHEADGEAWYRRAFEFSTTVNYSNHDAAAPSNWQWTDQLPGAPYPMFPAIARSTALDPAFSALPRPRPQALGPPAYGLEHVYDYDYLWLPLSAGVTYEFRTTIPAGSGVDTVLRALHLDTANGGAEMDDAINDDRANLTTGCVAPACQLCDPGSYGEGTLSSCIRFSPATTGAYAIAVHAYNHASTGAYGFDVRALDDAGGGLFGSDESIASARAMALDTAWAEGAWQTVGDLDYYRVQMPTVALPAGSQLRVEVCGLPPGAGESDATRLWISRRAAPTTIVGAAAGNNPATCGALAGTRVDIALLAADIGGGFLIRPEEDGLNQRGRYQVRAFVVDAVGAPILADGDGDLSLDASVVGTPIPLGQAPWSDAIAGVLEANSGSQSLDEDWYVFVAAEGEHIVAWTEGLGPNVDTVVDIWSDFTNFQPTVAGAQDVLFTVPSRAWLRSDDDWGTEALASRAHLVAARAGQYRVRVRPWQPAGANPPAGSPGRYVLHLTRSGWFTPALPAYP